eukprot:scaffold1919_cov394-Prasinococcus_capsulatus_cf.AAC.3
MPTKESAYFDGNREAAKRALDDFHGQKDRTAIPQQSTLGERRSHHAAKDDSLHLERRKLETRRVTEVVARQAGMTRRGPEQGQQRSQSGTSEAQPHDLNAGWDCQAPQWRANRAWLATGIDLGSDRQHARGPDRTSGPEALWPAFPFQRKDNPGPGAPSGRAGLPDRPNHPRKSAEDVKRLLSHCPFCLVLFNVELSASDRKAHIDECIS